MPIFRNTAALEACPAKTAESVSYAATFAVLGWLLVSNYPGLGSAEPDAQAVASTNSPSANTYPTTSFVDSEAQNETLTAAIAPKQPDIGSNSSLFVSSAPAWHSDLEQFQQFESHPHLRAFPTDAWSNQSSDADQQIEGFIEGLNLALPLIDANYLFSARDIFDTGIGDDLATGSEAGKNELVREITVTGTETDRLSSRPDNVLRPQIPRPYRAQEIQRSFILPPRIQALRP